MGEKNLFLSTQSLLWIKSCLSIYLKLILISSKVSLNEHGYSVTWGLETNVTVASVVTVTSATRYLNWRTRGCQVPAAPAYFSHAWALNWKCLRAGPQEQDGAQKSFSCLVWKQWWWLVAQGSCPPPGYSLCVQARSQRRLLLTRVKQIFACFPLLPQRGLFPCRSVSLPSTPHSTPTFLFCA